MAQEKIIVTKPNSNIETSLDDLKELIQQLDHEDLQAVLNNQVDNLKQIINRYSNPDAHSHHSLKRNELIKQMKNELEKYIEEIDFPLFMHIQMILSLLAKKDVFVSLDASSDKKTLHEIAAYINNDKFKKAVELLNTVTQFDFSASLNISNQDHPLFNIFICYLLNRWKNNYSPEMTIDMKRVIYLLREKGCLLPFNLWSREDTCNLNFHDEKNFFHCLLLLTIEHKDSHLRERLRTTSIWSNNPPSSSNWNTEVYCADDFMNKGLDTNTFEKIRDYFINVSQLFSDKTACLKYLGIIDKKLEETGFAPDLQKVTPVGYMGTRFFDFPVSSPAHIPIKKFGKLRQVLRKLLTGTREHPEINLLPSGDFWDIYGFIKPNLAKELALQGELFWDKRYDVQTNIHGSASHPLQFAILTLAHLSGEYPLPENMTMRDVLKYAFSIKIRLNNGPIWAKLFDITYEKFSSPQFIQTVIMGPLGEKHCPHLCAYMRDSFWRHYQLSREKHQSSLESQILTDLLCNNLFLGSLSFNYSFSDLQNRYRTQGIMTKPYKDGVHTIFKKERPMNESEDNCSPNMRRES